MKLSTLLILLQMSPHLSQAGFEHLLNQAIAMYLSAPSEPVWGHTWANRVGVRSPELSVVQHPWLSPFLVDEGELRRGRVTVYWDCPYFCWCKQIEFLRGKLLRGWAFLTRDKWVLSTWVLIIKHKIAFGLQSGSCARPGGFVQAFCEHWASLYSFLQWEQLSPFPVKHRLLLL